MERHCARATTPSMSPTSDKWQYFVWVKKTWEDDPALTVKGLSEKPSGCEVTISLSEETKSKIEEPGVEGLYKADGSYSRGRPVLRHSGGRYTLSVSGNRRWGWAVSFSVISGSRYIESGTAPSQCPADPRAATSKREDQERIMKVQREGRTHWKYFTKLGAEIESSGISVECRKHKH